MTPSSSVRTFEVRHVQLARAGFAALAALMITFSPDHSAAVGAAVFSGFAIATGLVFLLAAWLVSPTGGRGAAIALGAVTVVAGIVASLPPVRSVAGFFIVVIAWAVIAGAVELAVGARALLRARKAARTDASDTDAAPRRAGYVAPWTPRDGATPVAPLSRGDARDAVVVGVLGILLAVGMLLVPTGYALRYTIEEAGQTFTLTGIIIAVGIFGAYAAIVAVYLAIAGFSPRPATASASPETADAAALGVTATGAPTPADPKDSA